MLLTITCFCVAVDDSSVLLEIGSGLFSQCANGIFCGTSEDDTTDYISSDDGESVPPPAKKRKTKTKSASTSKGQANQSSSEQCSSKPIKVRERL